MEHAFEEIVARGLDDLYQGALHLTSGDRERADDLVVETVSAAARSYRRERPEDAESLLEEHLVRTFLEGEGAGGKRRWKHGEDERPDPAEGAEEVLASLAALDPRVRSVIWLVVVRRRSYRDVARVLGVDRTQVTEWVREGHRTLFRTGAWEPWRNGTT